MYGEVGRRRRYPTGGKENWRWVGLCWSCVRGTNSGSLQL